MAKIRIIVPTDFSEIATNALTEAVKLAKKIDGEIITVNAFNLPVSYGEVGVHGLVKGMAYEVEKNIEKQLIELEDNIEGLSSLLYKTEVRHGRVSEVINSMVRLHKADLVVMGTKGSSGLEEVILGSNASDTLKFSECPVLVIPEKSSINCLKKVILATDLKGIEDKELLAPLKLILLLFESELCILHINTSEYELTSSEIDEKKSLEEYFGDVPHIYHDTLGHSVEEGIKKYVSENPVHLLAMVRRNHSFWEKLLKGSQTKRMIDHGHTPVLVFPVHD